MLLKDRVAVITGNPYGIGRVSAALFAKEGARIVCIDDSQDGWSSNDGTTMQAMHIRADVSSRNSVAAAAAQCEQAFDRVDVLFNLTGRTIKQSFEATTEEAWNVMIGRNLTATFLCSQLFLPLMKKAGSGAIINHASIDGLLGNPSLAAYSAGKGGLIPLTHVMAHELGKYGIRVNCISTGAIRDEGAARAEDASRVQVTPLRRTGRPEDVARTALFLACEWSSYITGANIVVDGGRTAITQGCFEG